MRAPFSAFRYNTTDSGTPPIKASILKTLHMFRLATARYPVAMPVAYGRTKTLQRFNPEPAKVSLQLSALHP